VHRYLQTGDAPSKVTIATGVAPKNSLHFTIINICNSDINILNITNTLANNINTILKQYSVQLNMRENKYYAIKIKRKTTLTLHRETKMATRMNCQSV